MGQDDRIKWDARWAEGPRALEASAFVTRALDLAAGTGRHALACARRGLDATAVDVSPVGLAHAARLAREAGLALETLTLDLEEVDGGRAGFPEGPWDVIVGFHYLWRSLPRLAASALARGGLLLYCQPTERNLERHARPSARFLLREGELAELVGDVPELEVLSLEEGWLEEGRHEARVIARRR